MHLLDASARWLVALCCLALAATVCPAESHPQSRGIAVLSSNVSGDVSGEILAFTESCRINLVVIDFAWVTHHWPRTDLAAVEKLCSALRRRGVEVAAMYRPRVLRPGEASVHPALDRRGVAAAHHNDLCFAHEDSCGWAADWGTKILAAVPSVDRIILYNVLATCACDHCRDGRGRDHAAAFIQRCRGEWRRLRPDVRVGHVGTGDAYVEHVDFIWPFVPVNRASAEPFDPGPSVTDAKRLAAKLAPKQVLPLLKVCWAEATRNDATDVARAIDACDRAGVGFVLWYYEWVFYADGNRYDREAVARALRATGETSCESSHPAPR
jgi:hypothetical protein